MRVTTVFQGAAITVYDFRCSAGPADQRFVEIHRAHSISYVRRGSFGCRTLGDAFELVAGALMVGRPGQEYVATHEHHARGDECLSVKLTPEFAESVGHRKIWEVARVPPLPELMVLGELAQAAVEGRAGIGVDEAALLLATRFVAVASGEKRIPRKTNLKERRCAIEAALWLEANSAEPVGLEGAAHQAGLSPFHFLRVFAKVVGVTPHQYLVRSRLRNAARLLADETRPVTDVALAVGFADLSNFVRTFRRAAGVSPRGFRRTARRERKILQDHLASQPLG